jgi:hypothetical protein
MQAPSAASAAGAADTVGCAAAAPPQAIGRQVQDALQQGAERASEAQP